MTYVDIYLNQAGSTFLAVHWMQSLSIKKRYHLNEDTLVPLLCNFGLEFDLSKEFPEDTEWILIGSGMNSSAYEELIVTAKEKKIKTSLILDSWVNFEKRIQTPPDEIVVFDNWALELSKKVFPNVKCILLFNYYLEDLLANFKRIETKHILILDSINNSYSNHHLGSHGNNCICEYALRVNQVYNVETVIRRHPSRKSIECESFLTESSLTHDSGRVRFSSMSFIVDLQHSIFLLGPASYAHYLAESLGVPAFFSKKPNFRWHGPKFRDLQL